MLNSATLFKIFRSWLLKLFWPWFKREVWPGLRIYITELLVLMASDMIRRTRDNYNRKGQSREEMISRKIEEADTKAAESSDQSEIEKQRAVAQVWREVAEMYRQENEELQQELDEIRDSSVENTKKVLDGIRLNLDKNDQGERSVTLSINENRQVLKLPDPSELSDEDDS